MINCGFPTKAEGSVFCPDLFCVTRFAFLTPGRLVGELVGLLTGDGGDKSGHTHLKVHLWYAWSKTIIHVQMVALRRTNVFS